MVEPGVSPVARVVGQGKLSVLTPLLSPTIYTDPTLEKAPAGGGADRNLMTFFECSSHSRGANILAGREQGGLAPEPPLATGLPGVQKNEINLSQCKPQLKTKSKYLWKFLTITNVFIHESATILFMTCHCVYFSKLFIVVSLSLSLFL